MARVEEAGNEPQLSCKERITEFCEISTRVKIGLHVPASQLQEDLSLNLKIVKIQHMWQKAETQVRANVDEWVDAQMRRWADQQINRFMNVWVGGWMDEWINGWMGR